MPFSSYQETEPAREWNNWTQSCELLISDESEHLHAAYLRL